MNASSSTTALPSNDLSRANASPSSLEQHPALLLRSADSCPYLAGASGCRVRLASDLDLCKLVAFPRIVGGFESESCYVYRALQRLLSASLTTKDALWVDLSFLLNSAESSKDRSKLLSVIHYWLNADESQNPNECACEIFCGMDQDEKSTQWLCPVSCIFSCCCCSHLVHSEHLGCH